MVLVPESFAEKMLSAGSFDSYSYLPKAMHSRMDYSVASNMFSRAVEVCNAARLQNSILNASAEGRQ